MESIDAEDESHISANKENPKNQHERAFKKQDANPTKVERFCLLDVKLRDLMRVITADRVHQVIKCLSKISNFMLPNLLCGILRISQLSENSVRLSCSVHLTDNL